MNRNLFFIPVLMVIQPLVAKAQLVASSHTIDLGVIDRRDERQIIVPLINQSGSDLQCRPLINGHSVNASVSSRINHQDQGELRLVLNYNVKRKISERILVFTSLQKDPISFRIKARFSNAGNLDCPDFDKKKRLKTSVVKQVRISGKQPMPVYLRSMQTLREDFSADVRVPACHLVILMDASTSMQSNGRLEEIKEVLREVIRSLRYQDEVSIIKYNQEDEVIIVKQKIGKENILLETIENIEPWGYTNGYSGVLAAVNLAETQSESGRSNHILLCSDGAFNFGEDAGEIRELLMMRKDEFTFRFSVLAVGKNVAFTEDLKRISSAGNGHFYRLRPKGINASRIRRILVQQLM